MFPGAVRKPRETPVEGVILSRPLMNLKELRELIDMVAAEPAIEEFEFERAGVRVRIRQGGTGHADVRIHTPQAVEEVAGAPAPPATAEAAPAEDPELREITSPMVGTFYRSPSPDAEPFVKVGDFVEKGSVVCIIEAMKLMNEIEAEVAGEVISIRVENGHPVEYGDALMVVRPQ
jgi:acetyl-CoA carboxylase biotin carboxyl carrier protein